jgi:hypothetical protein
MQRAQARGGAVRSRGRTADVRRHAEFRYGAGRAVGQQVRHRAAGGGRQHARDVEAVAVQHAPLLRASAISSVSRGDESHCSRLDLQQAGVMGQTAQALH